MEHPLPYHYIRTSPDLIKAIDALNSCSEIAVDIEFDRDRYAYGFNLCLIQIFGNGISYLFDPFSEIDFKPVLELLENSTILKVMHSPAEDLQLLHKLNCFPVFIFDTERSARLLNYGAFSLSNLLLGILNVAIDKTQQKSNWTRTPLSDSQLKYAASDVAYLIQLKDELLNLAMERGLTFWIKEENDFWNQYRVEEKPTGHFANKEDSKKLPPYQLYVYNAVLGLRDRIASGLNKPAYQIIPKELAMDLIFKPEILDTWQSQKGIHPNVKSLEFIEELRTVLERSNEEATAAGLTKRTEAGRLSFTEREEAARERERIAQLVELNFRPIHEKIIERYGENTAAYILNEKTMTELMSSKLKLSDLPYAYRVNLIQSIASELEINLPIKFSSD